jgi:hypothetical protein
MLAPVLPCAIATVSRRVQAGVSHMTGRRQLPQRLDALVAVNNYYYVMLGLG